MSFAGHLKLMAQDDEETCLRVNSNWWGNLFVCLSKNIIYLVESSANIKIYLPSAKYLLQLRSNLPAHQGNLATIDLRIKLLTQKLWISIIASGI
jgi:hypothetical protein